VSAPVPNRFALRWTKAGTVLGLAVYIPFMVVSWPGGPGCYWWLMLGLAAALDCIAMGAVVGRALDLAADYERWELRDDGQA
jgi:hypothetical protein